MSELPTNQNNARESALQNERPVQIDHIGQSDQLFSEARLGVAAAVNGEVIDLSSNEKSPAIWDMEPNASSQPVIEMSSTEEAIRRLDAPQSIARIMGISEFMERCQDDFITTA